MVDGQQPPCGGLAESRDPLRDSVLAAGRVCYSPRLTHPISRRRVTIGGRNSMHYRHLARSLARPADGAARRNGLFIGCLAESDPHPAQKPMLCRDSSHPRADFHLRRRRGCSMESLFHGLLATRFGGNRCAQSKTLDPSGNRQDLGSTRYERGPGGVRAAMQDSTPTSARRRRLGRHRR